MNCGLYRKTLSELARGNPADGALSAHLEGCAGCRDFLAGQRRLSASLRAVATVAAATPLPKGLESELLAEFDAVHRVAPRPLTFWFTAGALALTAAAAVAVVLLRTSASDPKPQPVAAVSKRAPAVEKAAPAAPLLLARPVTVPPRPLRNRGPVSPPAETQEAAFVAIPYTLPLAANERADVVRMDVPVAALIAAGLPLRVQDMSANASADVLVGEDGRARAVRLISVADTSSDRRFR